MEVGKLSDTIGFGIEDIGRVVLPGYLKRHFDIDIEGELGRRFFTVDDEEIEFNLYGVGKRNGRRIIILGEAKTRIYRREVENFVNTVKKLGTIGEVFKVMFGFLVHPSGSELAEEEGVLLVASYQR